MSLSSIQSGTNVAQVAIDKFKNAPPPVNNMGGIPFKTSAIDSDSVGNPLLQKNNKLFRNPNHLSNAAFIDWLNFSFTASNFYNAFPDCSAITSDDKDFILAISDELVKCLGFGVTSFADCGRKNFYSKSYLIGDNWGFLCIGGDTQKDSITIIINGQGCMASKPNSQKLLYNLLTKIDGKITRVDCTADFFEGEYTVDKAVEDYLAGEYSIKGTMPSCRQDGNWLIPNKEGRTFYVGKKINGKECCIYEKGKQLGGNFYYDFPDWVRVELRYGSKDRVIPLDILLHPGQYLAAGYPALGFISEEQKKVKTMKAKAKIIYEKAKNVIKHQYGKYLKVIQEVEGSLDCLFVDEFPARLIMPDCDNRMLPDISGDDFSVSQCVAIEVSF